MLLITIFIMIFQLILIILAVLTYGYFKLTKNRDYWSERGVVNSEFKFFWGDDGPLLKQELSIHEWALQIYQTFPNKPYVGMWTMLGRPYLMIRNDFELIKSIWIKDFDHFTIANDTAKTLKDIWPADRNEKLMLNNLSSAEGDKWKNLR